MLEILLFVPHFKYWHHQKRNFSKFYLMLRFPLFFWLKISPNYVFPLKTMDLCLLLWLCILGPAHSRFWKFCKINQSLTTRPHLLYKNSKQEQPYATWKIGKTFFIIFLSELLFFKVHIFWEGTKSSSYFWHYLKLTHFEKAIKFEKISHLFWR